MKWEQIMDLLETDVDLAMKLAMAYWKMKEINTKIMSKTYDINECEDISRKINGGDNGMPKRKKIHGRSI